MSLKNACARFGVTQEQCEKAKLPCQWRSHFGNLYAVVKADDVLELKKKLKEEAKDAEDAKMLEKLGSQEAFDKWKKEEADREAAKEQAKQDNEKRTSLQSSLQRKTMETLELVGTYGLLDKDHSLPRRKSNKSGSSMIMT